MLSLKKDEKNRGIYLLFCISLFILPDEAEGFHKENPSLSFFCLGPALCHVQTVISSSISCDQTKEHRVQHLMGINIRQWQNLGHSGYSKRGHYSSPSLLAAILHIIIDSLNNK